MKCEAEPAWSRPTACLCGAMFPKPPINLVPVRPGFGNGMNDFEQPLFPFSIKNASTHGTRASMVSTSEVIAVFDDITWDQRYPTSQISQKILK